jgi:thymidylate kinase
MSIIHILGTDGSGKTTLARRLASESVHPNKLVYVYCQVTPILVRPLQWLARLVFIRRADQFKDFDTYKARKEAASSKRKRLTRVFCLVWYMDCLTQTWLKLAYARLKGRRMIVDRYYLDTVVNQGVLQNNDVEGMLRDARLMEMFLPKSNIHIFLDVDEDSAFARKDDIQSVEYLRQRKTRYRHLSRHYSFHIVDANQSAAEVFDEVQELLKEERKELGYEQTR